MRGRIFGGARRLLHPMRATRSASSDWCCCHAPEGHKVSQRERDVRAVGVYEYPPPTVRRIAHLVELGTRPALGHVIRTRLPLRLCAGHLLLTSFSNNYPWRQGKIARDWMFVRVVMAGEVKVARWTRDAT